MKHTIMIICLVATLSISSVITVEMTESWLSDSSDITNEISMLAITIYDSDHNTILSDGWNWTLDNAGTYSIDSSIDSITFIIGSGNIVGSTTTESGSKIVQLQNGCNFITDGPTNISLCKNPT